ncbi:hypothetical protein TcasGA2_TC001650 [Tribolium castaneum]|uniref:Uncharacterized protein n=1 Tax=Tribolium castaneum TaxID=7070 RepID=D6X1M8_TRICA|nr:hypothetical protein TcasGA2_TC001650 [Tribolium castaneum]
MAPRLKGAVQYATTFYSETTRRFVIRPSLTALSSISKKIVVNIKPKKYLFGENLTHKLNAAKALEKTTQHLKAQKFLTWKKQGRRYTEELHLSESQQGTKAIPTRRH